MSCVRCGHSGEPRRAPLAARLGLAGLYVAFALMLTGAALTGLGLVGLAPLAIALAALIQAPLAEAALAPPRCARCGTWLPDDAPVAHRAPAAAPARAVEA